MSTKTIICGSPREEGRSIELAQSIFEAAIAEDPESCATLITLFDLDINGCLGCNSCKGTCSCVIDDDMQPIYEYINDSDEIVIVSPVYMAGVPSQLKALLDRLQPYFWSDARNGELRSASVHLLGDGHDPFGSEGAVLTIKSALLVAGFEVRDVKLYID